MFVAFVPAAVLGLAFGTLIKQYLFFAVPVALAFGSAFHEALAAHYAELAGDGNSLSSYRITDSPPDGDGPIQAMRQALWSAGAAPADIDYLNAHGTSTGMNDRSESAAVKAVFAADGAIKPWEMAKHRLRWLTDGAVIGSKEFVAEMRMQLREKLGLKRVSGAFPVQESKDCCALRALREMD